MNRMRRDLQRRRVREGGAASGSHGRNQDGSERHVYNRQGKDVSGRPASAPTTTATAVAMSMRTIGSSEGERRGDSEEGRRAGRRGG